MKREINIVVVDQDTEMRAVLVRAIAGIAGYHCVGDYPTLSAAALAIHEVKPDVVLLDERNTEIAQSIQLIKESVPGISFIMCTAFDTNDNLFIVLREGMAAYVLKSGEPAHLLEAIKEAVLHGPVLTTPFARKIIDLLAFAEHNDLRTNGLLSEREIEVLSLLAEGMLYKEVAAKLHLSTETIRGHCRNIYEKLQVNSKIGAINKFFGGITKQAQ